jgi:hypothetical protein
LPALVVDDDIVDLADRGIVRAIDHRAHQLGAAPVGGVLAFDEAVMRGGCRRRQGVLRGANFQLRIRLGGKGRDRQRRD